jgi:hypothetical protein
MVLAALAIGSLSLAVAACGGGGSATGTAGQAAVGVSVSSSQDFPAGTTFASADALPAAAETAAPPSPAFDKILVAVTRIALIPSTGAPDANGQLEAENSPAENGPSGENGFVTVTLPSPVVIDLLHPPTAARIAKLLNRFTGVPAGAYGKIRVYYDNVVGIAGGESTTFHPTAHYHFDVHFVGGKLVIPVATGPSAGIRLYTVAIKVVGLKYHATGSGKYLLRPQIFAEVEALRYLVSGVADQVDPVARRFDIVTADNQVFHASWDALTDWFFADDRFIPVSGAAGADALRDTAIVDVAGVFGAAGALAADSIDIAFPAVASGTVGGGWLADNTFILRRATDNLVVYPQPGRAGAIYDNAAFPNETLSDAAIVDNAVVTARGYFTPGGILGYWLSIGP